jgi:hypothetical protein
MLHKVTCAACGKSERLEIDQKRHYPKTWRYFGKININASKTDKYFYEWPNWKRVTNPNYNTNVKRVVVEYWEHAKCDAPINAESN